MEIHLDEIVFVVTDDDRKAIARHRGWREGYMATYCDCQDFLRESCNRALSEIRKSSGDTRQADDG